MNRTSGAAGLTGIISTLALLAVILAISIPHASEFTQTARVRHEAKAVEHLLNRLVLAAETRESEVRAVVTSRELHVSGALRHFHRIKPPLQFGPSEQQTITFYPSGVVSPASFYLTGYGVTCQLIVSLRGRVRTQCFE